MKRLADYEDKWGLVCTLPGFDGGDALANEGTLAYCRLVSTGLGLGWSWRQLRKLRTENGAWIRHPDPSKWYSNPDCTSRDQLTPLLCFLAISGLKRPWKALIFQMAKRGFLFAFNSRRNFQYPTLAEHLVKSTPDVPWDYARKMPDVLGPDIWQIVARGIILHLAEHKYRLLVLLTLFPIMVLGDLQLLLGAAQNQYRWQFKRSGGTGRTGIDHDDRNFALKLHFANHAYSTPVARLARALYGTERPLACFESFWGQRAEEPPIDRHMRLLYSDD